MSLLSYLSSWLLFPLETSFDLLTCESHLFAWTSLVFGFKYNLHVECSSDKWQAMLRTVSMEASSNNRQSRHIHSPGKPLHPLNCHSGAVCMRRTKFLLVFWNAESPAVARSLGRGERMNYSDLWKSLNWALPLETDTDLCVVLIKETLIFLRLGSCSVTKTELQRVNWVRWNSMNFWEDQRKSPSRMTRSSPKTDLAMFLDCFTAKWPWVYRCVTLTFEPSVRVWEGCTLPVAKDAFTHL